MPDDDMKFRYSNFDIRYLVFLMQKPAHLVKEMRGQKAEGRDGISVRTRS